MVSRDIAGALPCHDLVSMGPRPGGHGKGKHFATLMHSDKNPFCANLRHSYYYIHKRAPLLGHNRYAAALHGRFFQMCRLISMGFLRGGSRKKLGLFQGLAELSISFGRHINAYRFYRCHALGWAWLHPSVWIEWPLRFRQRGLLTQRPFCMQWI